MRKYAELELDPSSLIKIVGSFAPGSVHLPVRPRGLSPRFIQGNDPGSVVSSNLVMVSPRKFIQPRRELSSPLSSPHKKASPAKQTILFGLSKEDVDGIYHLDRFFSEPIKDLRYAGRRAKMKVIGFDRAMPRHGSPDIFILDRGPRGTSKFTLIGSQSEVDPIAEIINKRPRAIRALPKATTRTNKGFSVLLDPRLPDKVLSSRGSRIWKDLAKICFGCGICTYVCPVCYCFTTEDDFSFFEANAPGQKTGHRHQCWDSCMLPDFTLVAGGHRFQDQLSDRIYNWFHHKFVRIPLEYEGLQGCVQCGRCMRYCPAKIDLREVLKDVTQEGKRS